MPSWTAVFRDNPGQAVINPALRFASVSSAFQLSFTEHPAPRVYSFRQEQAMCARSTAPARITALARLDSAALKAWHDLRRKLNVLADAALAGRVWMEPLEARTLLSTAVDLWAPALG